MCSGDGTQSSRSQDRCPATLAMSKNKHSAGLTGALDWCAPAQCNFCLIPVLIDRGLAWLTRHRHITSCSFPSSPRAERAQGFMDLGRFAKSRLNGTTDTKRSECDCRWRSHRGSLPRIGRSQSRLGQRAFHQQRTKVCLRPVQASRCAPWEQDSRLHAYDMHFPHKLPMRAQDSSEIIKYVCIPYTLSSR